MLTWNKTKRSVSKDLLKGTLKTIVLKLLEENERIYGSEIIGCLTGNCSIDNALKIGFIEFFIKLFIYYGHERLWQGVLKHDRIAHKQILHKTISWRMIAMTITFLISGSILDAFDEVALYIVIAETFTKMTLYYFHEKLWLKLPLGRIRKFFFSKKQV